MKHIILAGIIVMFSCSLAQAQTVGVPQLINYQGKLTDANGQPLPTADYSLEFNIYDSPTGGSVVWGPQVFPTVPVVLGYFNVILGPADANTDSRLIISAFSATDRFLGIKVNGAEIQPRQQILSAPYAMTAGRVNFAKSTDWGSIYFESESDASSNIVFETGDNGDEGFIFRTQTGITELVRINNWGLRVSTGQISTSGNLLADGSAVVSGNVVANGSLIGGGGVNFNPGSTWISNYYGFEAWPSGDFGETVDLGYHSFCALGIVVHDGSNGGSCAVFYDYGSHTWKLAYGKWGAGGIGCRVNCIN